jgi:hypothetical protein
MNKTAVISGILILFVSTLNSAAQQPAGEYTTSRPAVTDKELKELAEKERKTFKEEKARMRQDFNKKRREDTDAFRKQLEEMPPEARPEAIRIQNRAFYDEDLAFAEKMRQKNMDFLKWRVSQNMTMSEDEKQRIYTVYEEDVLANPSYSEDHYTRNVEKLEEMANTPGLDIQQKIDLYKVYRKEEVKLPAADDKTAAKKGAGTRSTAVTASPTAERSR